MTGFSSFETIFFVVSSTTKIPGKHFCTMWFVVKKRKKGGKRKKEKKFVVRMGATFSGAAR